VATVLAGLYFESVPLPLKKDLFVLWFCLALPFIFLRTKNLKVDAYIGELSYPMYMSHMFLSSVFYWLYGTTPLAFGLKLALATTLFSILINELVAKRIEKFRQQRVKRSSPQPAAS
jgi:peptidoglycan/LPS O-acetylase OafA/YrhL